MTIFFLGNKGYSDCVGNGGDYLAKKKQNLPKNPDLMSQLLKFFSC
mgnify:CR=1 FL=1